MSVRKPTRTKKASQRRPSSRGGMPARPTTKASTSPSMPSAVHQPIGVAITIKTKTRAAISLSRASSRCSGPVPALWRSSPSSRMGRGLFVLPARQDPGHPPGDAKDHQSADQAGGRRRQLDVIQARQLELVVGNRRGNG